MMMKKMKKMKINKNNFMNDGEVDFTAHYKENNRFGRVSLRFKDNRYEVYVHWFNDKTEEVLHSSKTLIDCVDFTNARFGLNDTVE
jgi:hypothetical protein